MDKTEFIWLNGKMVKWKDAQIHVLTHAFNYGTAVFEGIRVYQTPKGTAIFRLKDHVKRMVDSCKFMGIDIVIDGKKYGQKEIENAIKETVKKNKNVDYAKPTIYLAGEEVGLNPVGLPVGMSVVTIHMGDYFGKGGVGNGAKVIVSSWHRPDNLCAPAGAKANGSYVTSCLAKREAVTRGASEAVMLNSNGFVAECTGENIFIYRQGKIMTPKPSNSILQGVTRNSIIEVARDLGYVVEETDFCRFELTSADEVWMTGTAAEVAPVTFVDERPIGNGKVGPVTKEVRAKFADAARGKISKYEKWLDYVE